MARTKSKLLALRAFVEEYQEFLKKLQDVDEWEERESNSIISGIGYQFIARQGRFNILSDWMTKVVTVLSNDLYLEKLFGVMVNSHLESVAQLIASLRPSLEPMLKKRFWYLRGWGSSDLTRAFDMLAPMEFQH
ncbi:MAG: hypothetical protein ACTSUE_07720 [Promethearchaeota archaeon]